MKFFLIVRQDGEIEGSYENVSLLMDRAREIWEFEDGNILSLVEVDCVTGRAEHYADQDLVNAMKRDAQIERRENAAHIRAESDMRNFI